jgi:hypothetical protein
MGAFAVEFGWTPNDAYDLAWPDLVEMTLVIDQLSDARREQNSHQSQDAAYQKMA